MSLAYGRPFGALPGPSVIPDRVLRAMHRPAPDIYGAALADTTAQIKIDLQTMARTTAPALIYIGNGHAGWEAALNNIVNPGDHLLALETGRFTKGWANVAERLGAHVERIDFGARAAFDPGLVEDRLRADRAHKIKAIVCVQVDTASSVLNDIPALRAAIDVAGHSALLAVDCIASLGCEPYEMDAWGVDITVSACQKGLMTPPGLAFVHIGDRAWAARQSCQSVTSYWDWAPRRDPEMFYMNFFGTAPTHLLFGLETALQMILREEGLENVWHRHKVLSDAVAVAVEAWGADGPLECNIPNRAERANSVTAIRTGTVNAETIRQWCDTQAGVSLGIGLDFEEKDAPDHPYVFRIGHMGHLNPPMVMGVLGTVEAALHANDIPFGNGALSKAARIIAEG